MASTAVKIKCNFCGHNIRAHRKNKSILDGFHCMATNRIVCNRCKKDYYRDRIRKSDGAGIEVMEKPITLHEIPYFYSKRA